MTFEFLEPGSIDEAIALAGRYGTHAAFLAGGTDLLVQIHRGKRECACVISLANIEELKAIDAEGERISLGALVTHRSIERHPAFRGGLRALRESAEVIGGHQVRNVGTVGGNVCNASPAADLLPILLALDAQVHLRGPLGARSMPLSGFLQGPGRISKSADELLVAVTFARPASGAATAFLKFGRRRAMEISIVSAAAMVRLDDDGCCTDIRLALGAAAPSAIRLPEAESLLRGNSLSSEVLRAVGSAAARGCSPLSDVRASADYRRRLVEVLVPRALARAAERSRKEGT